MHAQLSQMAFSHLPKTMQTALQDHIKEIDNGAMAPDIYLQDWVNHEYNIHGNTEDNQAALARISELYESIGKELSSSDTDLSIVAYEMGLLSHYIADFNQPLHTDELEYEDQLHYSYESDVYLWFDNFLFTDKGVRYRYDLKNTVVESAEKANRFYFPVYSAYVDAYMVGKAGFNSVRGITRINVQRSIEDIRDIWSSLWLQNQPELINIDLWSNKKNFHPGETIDLKLSLFSNLASSTVKADLYIALHTPDGQFGFINEQYQPVTDGAQKFKRLVIKNSDTHILKQYLLLPDAKTGEYEIYALLVKADQDPDNTDNWLSSIATKKIQISPPTEVNIVELNNEVYLFPAVDPTSNIIALPLQRWDLIFLGKPEDDQYNNVVPGQYDQLQVYLGRDKKGVPYAVEINENTELNTMNFHLFRLPEFYQAAPDSEKLKLKVMTKPIWQYENRWAKRFIPGELIKISGNEKILLYTIKANLNNDINYLFENNRTGYMGNKTAVSFFTEDDLINSTRLEEIKAFLPVNNWP